MNNLISFLTLLTLFAFSSPILAQSPCGGSAGAYYQNPDGSEGGFVADTAEVGPSVHLGREVLICGRAKVTGNVRVSNRVQVFGEAKIQASNTGDLVELHGSAQVYGRAQIQGRAKVSGSAQIFGGAIIRENAHILSSPQIFGDAIIEGESKIFGNTRLSGDVKVLGQARVCDDLLIEDNITINSSEFCSSDQLSVVTQVCEEGGEVVLPEIGRVFFQSGTFSQCTNVTLSFGADEQVATDFEVTTQMFYPGPREAQELKVDTGSIRPQLPVLIERSLSQEFLDLLPIDSEIQTFVQIFQDQGGILRDPFELMPAELIDFDNRIAQVYVDRGGFTQYRNSAQTYETIVVLGSTLSTPDEELRKRQEGDFVQTGKASRVVPSRPGCQAISLENPLEGGRSNSTFDSQGDQSKGLSLDTTYGGYSGPVHASHAGEVVASGSYEKSLPEGVTHPSGQTSVGWGSFLIIGNEFVRTLYSNLDSTSVDLNVGDEVEAGSILGGVGLNERALKTFPEGVMVFKVANSPKYFSKTGSFDAIKCMGGNPLGDIDVGDTGDLADDAFEVYWDDFYVGETNVGEVNKLGLGNLRGGTYPLRLVVTAAPDEAATWGVRLSEGLEFLEGEGTSRDGVMPEVGAEHTLFVIVPGACEIDDGQNESCDKIRIKFENIQTNTREEGNGLLNGFLDYSNRFFANASNVKVILDGEGKDPETLYTDNEGILHLEGYERGTDLDLTVCSEFKVEKSGVETMSASVIGGSSSEGCSQGTYVYKETLTFGLEENKTVEILAGCTEALHGPCTVDGNYPNSRDSAPFAILDTIKMGFDALLNTSVPKERFNFEHLNVVWGPDRANGSASYNANTIFLDGLANFNTAEFDRSSILHEFYHYFADHNTRNDSSPSRHGFYEPGRPLFILDEALATTFALIALNESVYVRTSGTNQGGSSVAFDIGSMTKENLPASVFKTTHGKGWYVEGVVVKLLYELARMHNTNASDALVKVLMSDNYKNSKSLLTIFNFVRQFKIVHQVPEEMQSEINDLFAEYYVELGDDSFSAELGDFQDIRTDAPYFAHPRRNNIYQVINRAVAGAGRLRGRYEDEELRLANRVATEKYFVLDPKGETSIKLELLNCEEGVTYKFEGYVNGQFINGNTMECGEPDPTMSFASPQGGPLVIKAHVEVEYDEKMSYDFELKYIDD